MNLKPKGLAVMVAPKEGWVIFTGEEGIAYLLDAIRKAWDQGETLKIEADGVLFVQRAQPKKLQERRKLK